MRADAASADRKRDVRAAARGWRRGNAIDDATLKAIDVAYADDRARLGPIFRIVTFGFSFLALNAFFGVIGLCTRGSAGFGVACGVFSIVLVVATEILTGPMKRADSGIESATALLGVIYAVVSLGFVLGTASVPDRVLVSVIFAATTLLATVASVRWGSWVLAIVAVLAAFFFLARMPGGRIWWMVAAMVLAPLLLLLSESDALPPSHRRSAQLGVILAICAFYAAVHVGSWDSRLLEWFVDFREPDRPPVALLRRLAILATALVPVAVTAFAVATRRAYLILLGVVLGVVSLGTLRYYVHVAPPWVVLTAAGAVALLCAIALRRFLADGVNGERYGFTADPLFEDPKRRHVAEVLGTVATFAPDARAMPTSEDRFRAGGGGYGGGGASGDF
jgi:MFS family permease